jgi:uncharacterized protein involved in outer membrane biogenesis
MKKLLKLCGFVAATFILLVIIGSLAFYHLLRVGEFRRFLISQLEQQTQLKVQMGEGDFDLGWISGIGFRDLRLSESAGAQPLLTAERITARVALLPLLQRKLIFYDVRLLKPAAQLVREKDGRIPLLDKLLSFPFLQQKSGEYEFDLRSIKIQQAQLQWIDRLPDGYPVTFRLRELDAEIERVGGQQLRKLLQDLLKTEKNHPPGVALQVSLKGTLEKDSQNSSVTIKGKLVSPQEAFEFRDTWWSADVKFNDLPANLLIEYGRGRIPFKSISGRLAQQLHIEGRPSERLHISGDLEFKQLGLDGPELFAAPLSAGDGSASFAVEWTPRRLAFSQLTIQSGDVSISIKGQVRSTTDDSHIQLQLTASPLPIAALRKFIPLKLIASSQTESLLASIQEGELNLKKAGIDASLAQMRHWAETGVGEGIWFEAELRNVGIKLNRDGALPLSGVEGHIALNKGLITLTDMNGSYGNSRLNSVAGTYAPRDRALNLQARGELDLAEVREQLMLGVFPVQAKMISNIQELTGRARAEVSVNRVKEGSPQITGRLALDNAQLRKDDFLLSQLRGDVNFTGTEIKGEKMTASLSGSPIQIDFVLKDYASQDGLFDISVGSTGLKPGILTRLLLSSGSVQDPGIVRGSVRYEGSLTNKDKRRFTGNLDLLNVQLATPPLLQPIRAMNGNIRIDESGIDFQNIRGLLVGFPSTVSGRWRYAERPQLVFDFTAPTLDITYLLSQVDAESSEFYANLQAQGRIAVAKGKIKAIEFGDFKSDVTIDRRVWRLTNLTARAAGGTVQAVTSIDDRPDTLSLRADSQVRGVPVQSFLRWFDMTTTEMTGTVNLTGSLETVGNDDAERKRNLNGAFNLKIEEGIIHRMRILVQILNLLDLSRWFTLQFPDLTKDGIRFRSIAADFKVNKGVYFTQNLVVDSDDLRMTGTGRIDVPKDDIDFIIAVRPFAGIDSAIHHIPLLGRGIAAIKNSFLVASFNIKGPIEEPTITPAPLGTLSEWFWGVLGIPKNMIGLGENQKKDDSKAAPK